MDYTDVLDTIAHTLELIRQIVGGMSTVINPLLRSIAFGLQMLIIYLLAKGDY